MGFAAPRRARFPPNGWALVWIVAVSVSVSVSTIGSILVFSFSPAIHTNGRRPFCSGHHTYFSPIQSECGYLSVSTESTGQSITTATAVSASPIAGGSEITGGATKSAWQVWKAIDKLEEFLYDNGNEDDNEDDNDSDEDSTESTSSSYFHPAPNELVAQVISILRSLAEKHEGKSEWQGILNKSTLFHEVEESILALHFLQQEFRVLESQSNSNHNNNNNNNNNKNKNIRREMVVVDACCGKGVFSLLCSYLFASSSASASSSSSALSLSSSSADTDRDRISDSNLSVRKIIMLDKDPKLRWDHVDATNNDRDPITNDNRNRNHHHHHHHSPRRPFIECWPNFNLHEIDEVVDRLSQQLQLSQDAATPETNAEDGKEEEEEEEAPVPVGETVISQLAVVGIHLCKTLSPTCIGIVNALGPERCPCLVLAPCCLPRVVVRSKNNPKHNRNPNPNPNPNTQNQNSKKATLLEVRRYETPDELRLRREAKQRRDAAMVRGRVGSGGGVGVGVGSRSARPRAMGDQVRLLHPDANADADGGAIAIPSGACWKCGEFGHRKKDCPSDQTTGKPKLIPPACVQLDVSDIILGEERPFRAYCDKLATTIQRDSVTIRETSIENEHYKKYGKTSNTKNQANNWNQERKSVFIVAVNTRASAE